MSSFSREIRTVQAMLAGSVWSADTQVQVVLDEYGHFVGSARLGNRERRTSLQILFASRAFDSLLAHVVRWEQARTGGANTNLSRQLTLGSSIVFIQEHYVNGGCFTDPTVVRLKDDLTRQRNRFMHEAGSFPTDAELTRFLDGTLAGIREIITWR